MTEMLKHQEDDNACLWIPTFLVPALLSSVVAFRPQLSGWQLESYDKCQNKLIM